MRSMQNLVVCIAHHDHQWGCDDLIKNWAQTNESI